MFFLNSLYFRYPHRNCTFVSSFFLAFCMPFKCFSARLSTPYLKNHLTFHINVSISFRTITCWFSIMSESILFCRCLSSVFSNEIFLAVNRWYRYRSVHLRHNKIFFEVSKLTQKTPKQKFPSGASHVQKFFPTWLRQVSL